MTSIAARFLLPCLALAGMACGDEGPVAPPPESRSDVLILNSTGQTLATFVVEGNGLRPAGSPIDLGAGFDGDRVSVGGGHVVSTVSSFGGSAIVRVDLESRAVERAFFPGPDAALVNPSRAFVGELDTVWVAGRGSNAIYRLDPGAEVAEMVASGVGSFVEGVIPGAGELYAIDANLDDDGLTYEPLGPGRVIVLERGSDERAVIPLPDGSPNPSDALLIGRRLIVLAGGSFDPANFQPRSDGAIVVVDVGSRAVVATRPLAANGVSLAAGADGRVYVSVTDDYASIRLLAFDPVRLDFDHGPSDPIPTVDATGAPVSCWSATALTDGRILCATFRADAPGRLLLYGPEGELLDEIPGGFGTTDVELLP